MKDSLLGDELPKNEMIEREATEESQVVDTLGAQLARNEKQILKVNKEISVAIAEMQDKQTKLAKRNTEIRTAIKDAMRDAGRSEYDDEFIHIKYVKATTRKGVDVKALAAENPELYKKYEKVSNVSDSIRIKVKEQ